MTIDRETPTPRETLRWLDWHGAALRIEQRAIAYGDEELADAAHAIAADIAAWPRNPPDATAVRTKLTTLADLQARLVVLLESR